MSKPAAQKQRQNSGQFKEGNGYRWPKGQTGNPRGRPRTHAELRQLIQSIAGEPVPGKQTQTRIEALVRKMLASKNATDRQHILEHGWGKVPLAVDLNLGTTLVEKAQELGIDWQSDPVLAEIFAAAGVAGARAPEDAGPGEAGAGELDGGGPRAGVPGQ